jgi:hypothetical protein
MKRIEFEYKGWKCWRNNFGYFGATLSRENEGLKIIDEIPNKSELLKIIDRQ